LGVKIFQAILSKILVLYGPENMYLIQPETLPAARLPSPSKARIMGKCYYPGSVVSSGCRVVATYSLLERMQVAAARMA